MADIFEPRPPQVEAMQFLDDSDSGFAITEWCLANGADSIWFDDAPYRETGLRIQKGINLTSVGRGDWLILNDDGSFTQCRDEYFKTMWRKVNA